MYRMNKLNNNIFPFLNFIFLSEEEKEKYFTKSNIAILKLIILIIMISH